MLNAHLPKSCLDKPEVQSGQASVIVVHRQSDYDAAVEAGMKFVLEIPDREWCDQNGEALAGVRDFIIAADTRPAGKRAEAEVVALLGADRCHFLEYPSSAQNLSDVLKEFGPQKIVDCILAARPYPVQGLFTLSDFPERGQVPAYDVGIKAIDELISIVPGTLTVVTGYANQGKSTLMNAIIGHALKEHFPVCVASFETDVKPILRDGLRCAILGCGKHELNSTPLFAADKILAQRLSIIAQTVDEDREMDLDHFLHLARLAVTRKGAKMIVLDPWNELEHRRRREETETEYIARALRAIKLFARQHDVSFWLVAHPTKPAIGKSAAPGLYDIAGSAHFANKADYGLTYNRPNFDANEAHIIVNKVRMGLPGKRGEVKVRFNFRTSRFEALEAN